MRSLAILGLIGGAAGELVGVFNEIGPAEIYYTQMVLHANGTADFGFLVNSACGKHNVPFPRLWEMRNMDYVDHGNGTLTFLHRPEDAVRPEIVDINKVFSTMGTFKLPVRVDVSPQKQLVTRILKLSVFLKEQPWIDLAQVFHRLSGDSTTSPALIDTYTRVNTPGIVEMAQSGTVSCFALGVLVAMPLAAGMTDWLSFS